MLLGGSGEGQSVASNGNEEMKTLEAKVVEVAEEKLLSDENGEERYWQVLAVRVTRESWWRGGPS